MNLSMGARHWAVLLATGAMYASSFFFHKVALSHFPPLTIGAVRVVISIPIALVVLRVMGGRLPPLGREWGSLGLMGLLGVVVPYTATAWGQQHIESGLGGILMAAVPVFSVALAHFLTADETFNLRRAAGVGAGLAGVVVVIGPAALQGLSDQVLGALVTLLAPLCYALVGITTRRVPRFSPAVLTAGQMISGAVIQVPMSLAVDGPWNFDVPAGSLWALLAIALVATAVPNLMVFWVIKQIGAVNSSLLSYFIPPFAVVFGAVLLGEKLPWPVFAGLGLILAGAYVVGKGRKAAP